MKSNTNIQEKPLATTPEVVQIPTEEIKFFLRRSRPTGGYSRLKDSIKEFGLHQPIQVMDIRCWSASERKRPDGGLYNYELICGQGRLQAFRELELATIPAIVLEVPEHEIVGRFLAENVIRKRMSWFEKAQFVKRDVGSGMEMEQIKKKYFITSGHVYKYLKILKQASVKLLESAEIEKMALADAEALTSMSPHEQEVIVEVLREENLPNNQILPLIRRARGAHGAGPLSTEALKASLRALDAELREVRNLLKVKRVHRSLGPDTVRRLLENPEFVAALRQHGVNIQRYLEATRTEAA